MIPDRSLLIHSKTRTTSPSGKTTRKWKKEKKMSKHTCTHHLDIKKKKKKKKKRKKKGKGWNHWKKMHPTNSQLLGHPLKVSETSLLSPSQAKSGVGYIVKTSKEGAQIPPPTHPTDVPKIEKEAKKKKK